MKKIDGMIEVRPGMKFEDVAVQIMNQATLEFLVARTLAIKTGRELGFSEEQILEGLDNYLKAFDKIFKEETEKKITCSFDHLHVVTKEKAPTEAATSGVDANLITQVKHTTNFGDCQGGFENGE